MKILVNRLGWFFNNRPCDSYCCGLRSDIDKNPPDKIRLRVLMVSHYSGRYGANCSMVDLAVELSKRNIEVVVVIPGRGEIEFELQSKNIRYAKIFHKNWIQSSGANSSLFQGVYIKSVNFLADLRMYMLSRKIGTDLIHINSSCTPVGFRASRWLKVPLVWHIREYLEEDYGLSFINRKSAMSEIGRASKVIAVSRDLASKYRELLGERLGVIYNGIHGMPDESKMLLEKKRLQLLLVGVLDPCKGHLDALKAVAIAKHEMGLDIHLKIVGDGNPEYLRSLTNAILEFDIKEEIEFMGYQTNLGGIRMKTDVALVCSRHEAFGRVTVEAMASGVLVVASRTGGTPEIIHHGKTGLLYEAGNPRHLAECLSWIDRNRNASRRIARFGQKRALENFNMSRVADEILDAYSECFSAVDSEHPAQGNTDDTERIYKK